MGKTFVSVALMLVMVLFLVGTSVGVWCDSDFAKRINVSVNNTAGSALTNYQVYVNLSSNPINETSLRVYNSSDCTLRHHWTENETGGNSYGVWINYSAIAASSWVNNTAIYYENSSATSNSSGNDTFILFDDFLGTSLNTNKWTNESQGTGSSVIVTSGECELHVPDDQICSANIQSVSTFTNGIASHTRRKCPNDEQYIYATLANGSMCDREGGTANWWHTTARSGYLWDIDDVVDNTYNKIYEMGTSGAGVGLTTYANFTASEINNYHVHKLFYGGENLSTKLLGEGFEQYGSNPLSIYDYGWNQGAVHPDVLYNSSSIDGYDFWMYYELVRDSGCREGLALERSVSDGVTFVNTSITNPILTCGVGWDAYYVADPDVVKVESTWYMWYVGQAASGQPSAIGLATSSDGKSWTKITNGIDGTSKVIEANTSLAWEQGDVLVSPTVWYNETSSMFWMWYVSKKSDTTHGVCLANSTDGINWTKNASNPVYSPAEDIWHLQVTKYDNKFWMYWVAYNWGVYPDIYLAKSSDMTSWTGSSNNPVLDQTGDSWQALGLYRPSWLQDDKGNGVLLSNKMWLYYSASADPMDFEIGLAKSWDNIGSGGGNLSWFLNDTQKGNIVSDTTFLNTNKHIILTQGAYSNAGMGAPTFIDWTFVRKYSLSDPSTTLGSEEQQAGGTTPVISNVVNGSISSTSQYINWTVNQTAHNSVLYSNESDLTPAWYSTWDNSTAAPNITLSALEASTQYWYQAWSYNVTNNSLSDNSSTLSFTTASESTYIPPDPTTLANTTGNFWVNHTWNNGTGNKTDSYNVSVNTSWYNTTTNEYYNNTELSTHGWSNITVYAFNSTGAGTLSNGNVSQDTQIPNNAVTISNCSNKNVIETQIVYVDIDSSDTDGDTPAYSCNRTDLFIDFGTSSGKGNWSTDTLDNGTYYVDFGVSDGYGSTDNCTVTIEVAEGTPTSPTNLDYTLSNGNQTINWTWTNGSNTDKTNATLNGTAIGNITSPYEYTNSTLPRWENLSIRGYNGTTDEFSGWTNETIYVLATTVPTLHIDNGINVKEDWGRDFNSNLSANATVANASGVWMNFSNAEFTNTSLGWVNLTLDEWVNESHNVNTPNSNISVSVYLNSTASGATNDTESFYYNITNRTNTIGMDSSATQDVDTSETFYVNATCSEEYSDTFYGGANLLEDGAIIDTDTSVTDYVNFSHSESTAGQYNYTIRFYNLTHYDNATTPTYSNVTVSAGEYIPPDANNSQNTTGNFWVNHTWTSGLGEPTENQTDSFNVSINLVWHNTTIVKYYNNSGLSAHDWSNISIWAYNNSGDGSLSNGYDFQDVQIPNNVPVLSGLPDNTTDEDINRTDIFDLDDYFTDADSDNPTYLVESNNQSSNVSVTINASNNVSYTLASGWNGTAEVVINVTDGWGGEDNDTFLIFVNAPSPPGDYIPPNPTNLANTTGNGWVNYTWDAGTPGNVTNSYNVSWNSTWYNITLVTFMNDTVGEFGWANISVWAFNSSGNGSLSVENVSDETQAGGGTYITTMTTGVYNLITYYGATNSTAEEFGIDIGNVDYVAKYNGSFYSHTMTYVSNNFTTVHGIGYYVYLNASGSSTYSRNNISDTLYNTQLFNRWNTIGWTNATDTNAEGVASSIGSACKYTSSLNADGVTYTTHTVGFTSNNHAVEKGEGYWIWVNTGVSWGRNS